MAAAKNKSASKSVGQPSAPEGAEAVLLVAVEPVKAGGKRVAPGEIFAVAPDAAKALLDAGAAAVADVAAGD